MPTNFTPKKRPVVLCILDGWGIGDGGEFDAIASADTPCFDAMMANHPNTTLTTFGNAVGLPEGQMGNSEVGHMNIGAGRVVMQYLPRIDKAFADGEVANNKDLQSLIADTKASGNAVHIIGLVSDGGVHAHINHVQSLADITAAAGVKTHIHALTDGRDCPPQSGKAFIQALEDHTADNANITLSTITGRYFAMDRDNRWERVERAYNAIMNGNGEPADNAGDFIQQNYDNDTTDEFIEPAILNGYEGFKDGDAIIFANFRSDRAREILNAIMFDDFDGFARAGGQRDIAHAISMVEYSDELNKVMSILFPPIKHENILGAVLADHGLKQMRMAETEKYPHVTFFFNAGREVPYDGEDRILVASPKVATYDLQPEMSAPELSEKLLKVVEANEHDVVIVNFANTDMVGHTGSIEAARAAAQSVDSTLCKLEAAVLANNGILLVTADHGNADQMFDPATNGPHTAHTLNPVPFIVVGDDNATLKEGGKLADIAPTMLHYVGIKQPEEMDGDVLITK
ncbi:MAG: 2,3-bisphosphoglycerate-independent phosphoglycerate mutase [Alphaproteobacteria bacterium]